MLLPDTSIRKSVAKKLNSFVCISIINESMESQLSKQEGAYQYTLP